MSLHDASTHLFLHQAREQELDARAAEVRVRRSPSTPSGGRRGDRPRLSRLSRLYRWATIASTRRGSSVAR